MHCDKNAGLRPYFFIHINKTGGTSVKKALGDRSPHQTARQIIASVGHDAWRNAFTFSIVRNPWDRVVSHYHWRVKTNQTDLGENPIPFSEWVRRAYGENDPTYYNNPDMFLPQTDWLTGAGESDDEIVVDFVGRFENLKADFLIICKRIGLSKAPNFPHEKKSDRSREYRNYYERSTKTIIADWFAEDIRNFNYDY